MAEDQKFEIVVADEAGACFGVERALKMARAAADESGGNAHTLGPLIHNPTVVSELEAAGVTVIEEPEEAAPGATVLLRTHGVTPSVEGRARATGARVVDATCPFVKRAHKAAERLERDGYDVVVVGEKGHPEVEGVAGHARRAVVVENGDDAGALAASKRVGVVVQTTQTQDLLRDVVGELLPRCTELRVVNTICEATNLRQTAAAELAERADAMIVIGGRNSANTTHLADICHDRCENTHHIETPADIDAAWFDGARLVGITAGASTPAEQIRAVRAAIAALR